MDTELILTCVLSSSVAVAVITTVKELVIWKLNRKATVEDKDDDINNRVSNVEKSRDQFLREFEEFKEDEDTAMNSVQSIKESMKKQRESLDKLSTSFTEFKQDMVNNYEVSKAADRYILGDHIEVTAMEYIASGKITYAARKKLHNMWDLYHYGLEANGDLDLVMKQIDELPLDLGEE